jgi:alkylation response protein AidB-like acyl-CoA dehydrogenase
MTMTGPLLSDDQRAFASTVRELVGKHNCTTHARACLDGAQPYPEALHFELASLGVFGLTVAEASGGLGLAVQDAAVVAEQLGGALAATSFLSSTLAALILGRAPLSETGDKLLRGLSEGTTSVAVLLAEGGPPSLSASRSPQGGHVLNGTASLVLDGQGASVLLVQACLEGEAALFAVDASTSGYTAVPLTAVDGSRQFAEITLTGAQAQILAVGADATAACDAALRDGWILVAADALGGARRCLEQTVSYAANRYQFGRAIGSFQAIKHRLADMLVAVETAESAVRYAAWAVDTARPDAAAAARVAKIVASESFLAVATDSIQIHGGSGFTWEFDAHLFLRRARSCYQLLGDPEMVANGLAALIGMPAEAVPPS